MFEIVEYVVGYGSCGGFLDVVYDYVEVICFYDNGDILGFECFYNGVGDFFCEVFLNLEVLGEYVCDLGEFRKVDDVVFGNIVDVYLEMGVSFYYIGILFCKKKKKYILLVNGIRWCL